MLGLEQVRTVGKHDQQWLVGPDPVPKKVVGLPAGTTAVELALGSFHTCALLNTGAVSCWGRNWFGQLGHATNTGGNNPNPSPTTVAGLPPGTKATAIAARNSHTCATLDNADVTCWGYNKWGQLGDGPIPAERMPILCRKWLTD